MCAREKRFCRSLFYEHEKLLLFLTLLKKTQFSLNEGQSALASESVVRCGTVISTVREDRINGDPLLSLVLDMNYFFQS